MEKKKILLVEDEEDLRDLLSLELKTSGYEIFNAKDGVEGLEAAERILPDLIISDVVMPNMDGNQLLRELRKTRFGANIPFIVLTARENMEEYFKTTDISAFLSKPFEATELLEAIENVLNADKRGADAKTLERKIRALILDDNMEFRHSLHEGLTSVGLQIKTYGSLTQCQEDKDISKPEVMLVRVSVEGTSVENIIPALREIPGVGEVPLIVYSEDSSHEQGKGVLEAGAAAFIGEADINKILEAIKKVLS